MPAGEISHCAARHGPGHHPHGDDEQDRYPRPSLLRGTLNAYGAQVAERHAAGTRSSRHVQLHLALAYLAVFSVYGSAGLVMSQRVQAIDFHHKTSGLAL